MRRNQIAVAVGAVELGLVKVKLLAVQRFDAGLECDNSEENVVESDCDCEKDGRIKDRLIYMDYGHLAIILNSLIITETKNKLLIPKTM